MCADNRGYRSLVNFGDFKLTDEGLDRRQRLLKVLANREGVAYSDSNDLALGHVEHPRKDVEAFLHGRLVVEGLVDYGVFAVAELQDRLNLQNFGYETGKLSDSSALNGAIQVVENHEAGNSFVPIFNVAFDFRDCLAFAHHLKHIQNESAQGYGCVLTVEQIKVFLVGELLVKQRSSLVVGAGQTRRNRQKNDAVILLRSLLDRLHDVGGGRQGCFDVGVLSGQSFVKFLFGYFPAIAICFSVNGDKQRNHEDIGNFPRFNRRTGVGYNGYFFRHVLLPAMARAGKTNVRKL